MAVEWSEYRFAGGALALDLANTVVLRDDPVRTFDRFADASELPRFAAAASYFRRDEFGDAELLVADSVRERPLAVELREAIDTLFRNGVRRAQLDAAGLSRLLGLCSDSLQDRQAGAGLSVKGRPLRGVSTSLRAAAAISALSLLPEASRVRICQNCCWLFVDRSRNGSRRWCDMAVCGNRQKQKRHYRRRLANGGKNVD